MRETSRICTSLLGVFGLFAAACTASGAGKTQTKYLADTPVIRTASADYTPGDTIEIADANGNVNVTPVVGLTKIQVSATPFAFADTKSDADPAIIEVTGTIAIDRGSNGFRVHCSESAMQHGSAAYEMTGCDLDVRIPAGDPTQGVSLNVATYKGDVTLSLLFGSATIHSGIGEVTAYVFPTPGAVVDVLSGNGDVTLTLPVNFTTDSITLTSGGPRPKVVNYDFPDVNDTASAHRKPGGAKSITVKADNGTVTLKSS
jgi:hypothetical protein